MGRKVLTIVERATGKTVASYDTAEYFMPRNSSKTKPRANPKMTNDEVEALVRRHGKYDYRSARVQAARLVLTEHLSVTEAAHRIGVTPNNVWSVVAALEAHLASEKEFE